MTTNFIRFSKRSDAKSSDKIVDEDYPNCFGESWDPNDEDFCQACDLFDECASELTKRSRAASQKRTTARSTTRSTTTTYNGSTTQHNTSIQRPKTPEGFPPGTEYLPPEEAGDHTMVRRAFAIMKTEGLAAMGNQIGQSFSRFFRDPSNWNRNAGRWRYGENYGPEKKTRQTKKTPKTRKDET